MTEMIPKVVRWNDFPLDLTEPIKLFEVSQFNYLYKNQEAGVLMGYWEVEKGEEIAQDEFDLQPFHEVIVVLEGKFYVGDAQGEEEIAGPGDLIMIHPDRKTQIRVEERSRAFFLVYGTDPEDIERTMQPKKVST